MNLLFVLLFLLDRLTKWLFFDASVLNTGVAFGLFGGNNVLLAILTAILFVAVIWWYYKEPSVGLTLVAAGALGNLFDRVLFGGVVDFIDLGFWPAFNVADALVVVGVGLLLYRELYIGVKKS